MSDDKRISLRNYRLQEAKDKLVFFIASKTDAEQQLQNATEFVEAVSHYFEASD